MLFGLPGSLEIQAELKRRKAEEFEAKIPTSELDTDDEYYSERNTEIVSREADFTVLKRKKPLPERFEDKLWLLFHRLGATALPIRRTVIEYQKSLTRQIDGLFADEHHVYVVECKSATKRKGKERKSVSLREELQKWKGTLTAIQKRLQDFDEFRGKRLTFILASKGIEIEDPTKAEGEGFVHFLDDVTVTQLLDLAEVMGEGARAVLHQHLFRFKEIPGEPQQVHALRIKHAGTNLYAFFANAQQLMDLAYIHRKEPTNANLSTAYQRFVNPSKVANISAYLEKAGNFFANSIVVTFQKAIFEVASGDEPSPQMGMLTLPNTYGSVWVIDGQHRLFGSAAQAETRQKHMPVVAIEGMSEEEQGQLFRVINEEQSEVPKDLLWDIYGDLRINLENPSDDEWEMARKKVISTLWRQINQQATHPLAGRLVIPSQTLKTDACFIPFSLVCDMLDSSDLWAQGRLRGERWSSAENFARKRVALFATLIVQEFPGELEKGKKGWLFGSYSVRVLFPIFRYAVLMFAEQKYETDWRSKPEVLIEKFVKELGAAMRLPHVNYVGRIRDAGNAATRQEIVRDLVERLRQTYPTLAPKLAQAEESDEGDEKPALNVYIRSRDLEVTIRDLVFDALVASHGKAWFDKVPEKQRTKIEEGVAERRALGDKLREKPDRNWLDATTLSDLKLILLYEKNWPIFKDYLGGKRDIFETRFDDFILLRNAVAHAKTYPSRHEKQRWLSTLDYLEQLAEAFPKPAEPATKKLTHPTTEDDGET